MRHWTKSFDTKSFLLKHPGGREVLLDVAGKDASQDFEDVGHSSAAEYESLFEH